jgi:hypothetical protein
MKADPRPRPQPDGGEGFWGKKILPGGGHIEIVVPDLRLQLCPPSPCQLMDLADGAGIKPLF